jgi:P-type conjugative transfer protein TrbJ
MLARRKRLILLLLLIGTSLGTVTRCWGIFGVGDVVFDPTNVVQTTLTALNTLEITLQQATQIANEVLMIANQVTALANDAKNLASGTFSMVGDMAGSMDQYTDLLREADGLTFQVSGLSAQYAKLYPTYGRGMDSRTLVTDSAKWREQVRAALASAMQSQAIVDRLAGQQERLTEAIQASQRAQGNLEVQQATNQLIGLLVEQQGSLQQIQAASHRAQASMLASQLSAEEAARANAEKFFGNMERYTPGPPPVLQWRRD